jgi:hypothetical protein
MAVKTKTRIASKPEQPPAGIKTLSSLSTKAIDRRLERNSNRSKQDADYQVEYARRMGGTETRF